MNRVGPIPHEGVSPGQSQPAPQPSQPPSTPPAADRVELSAVARGLPVASDAARIAEVRARIADGTYLTPDKLEAAIEGLYRDALPGTFLDEPVGAA